MYLDKNILCMLLFLAKGIQTEFFIVLLLQNLVLTFDDLKGQNFHLPNLQMLASDHQACCTILNSRSRRDAEDIYFGTVLITALLRCMIIICNFIAIIVCLRVLFLGERNGGEKNLLSP